jgi:hypothetical protein
MLCQVHPMQQNEIFNKNIPEPGLGTGREITWKMVLQFPKNRLEVHAMKS